MAIVKATIYTALGYIVFVVLLFLLLTRKSVEWLGFSSESGHVLTLTQFFILYFGVMLTILLVSFPLTARLMYQSFTKLKWVCFNFFIAFILLLIISVIANNYNQLEIRVNIYGIFISFLLLVSIFGFVWLVFFEKELCKLTPGRYVKKYFSGFDIEHDFFTLGRNKIFILSRDDKKYVLKVTGKNARKARREEVLLKYLQKYLTVPEVISSFTQFKRGHILMSYCGERLSKSRNKDDYYRLGKLIAKISDVPLGFFIRAKLNKNPNKKIKEFISGRVEEHLYLEYLKSYEDFSNSYFSHHDISLNQVLVKDNKQYVVDWESASMSFRVFDLAKAISDVLKWQHSEQLAKHILDGYESVIPINRRKERELLIGVIWWDLCTMKEFWEKNNIESERINYINPFIQNRELEAIVSLKSDVYR